MTTIICILVLVVVFFYIKGLSKEHRQEQAAIAKDITIMTAFTTAKVAKEVVIGAKNIGELSAKTVEKEHRDTIKGMKESLDNLKAEHNGSVQRTGLHYGNHICEVTGINAVNDWTKKELEELANLERAATQGNADEQTRSTETN